MKYIALLSGGKDSCFNLLHCKKNGHELIAAASMSPISGREEIDSYLYQTVGQDAIELVAEALEVPLYRGIIKGTAVDQRSEYGKREPGKLEGVKGDETEDLFDLLSTVKKAHPDAEGVSVGAILSSYQRVRVEHVCQRLALVPLCYLWQRDQGELLSEMIDSGLEAVLIKVAGIGLTSKHLGKSLAEMQPTVKRLNEQYGSHICGEGGEYESFTLDCPLFKRRIRLDETEVVIHSDGDFASVAYLRIRQACLVQKEEPMREPVNAPDLLSEAYDELYRDLLKKKELDRPAQQFAKPSDFNLSQPSSSRRGPWIVVTNVHTAPDVSAKMSVEKETDVCFGILKDCLQSKSVSLSEIAFMTVYISDMSLFSSINQVYKKYFGLNPPGRACVAVDLPSDMKMKIDCLAYAEDTTSSRRALHVQGLSYWAPANIGPYSQAVSVGDQIFVSGQIGMRPSDLSMPLPQSFPLETALSFQHASRIVDLLKEMFGSTWAPAMQLIVCWLIEEKFVGVLRSVQAKNLMTVAPFLMVGAKSLPKSALVETQVFAHTGQYVITELGIEESNMCTAPGFRSGQHGGDSTFALEWQTVRFSEIKSSALVIAVKGYSNERFDLKAILDDSVDSLIMLNVFFTKPGFKSAAMFIEKVLNASISTSYVPVRFVSTLKADDWDFAVCLLTSSS